jgi:CRP-like cAMP-binding protein
MGLSDSKAQSVQPFMKPRFFEAGVSLWRKGAVVDSWVFISGGTVGAYMPNEFGAAIAIELYGAGSWFGEQFILSSTPSDADYVCLADLDAFYIPVAIVENLINAEMNFCRHLLRLTSMSSRRRFESLALQRSGSSCAKVVLGLALMGETLSRARQDENDTRNVVIPVSQGMLSALCGVSRTVFSNFLLQLERGGRLAVSYGSVELKSIGFWQALINAQRNNFGVATLATLDEMIAAAERNSNASVAGFSELN